MRSFSSLSLKLSLIVPRFSQRGASDVSVKIWQTFPDCDNQVNVEIRSI